MLSKRQTKLGVLLISVLLLSGCGLINRPITLYPIQQTDFYVQENGDICMSEFYFNEVLQVKLKEKK